MTIRGALMHLIKQKLSVKCYQLIPSVLLLIFLVISGQNCLAGEIEYTNRELIRNGDFEEDLHTAWFERFCNVHYSAVKDGNRSMRMNFFSGRDERFFFQKLNVPSTLQSATIHFDYRVVEDKYLDPDPIKLQVCIAKSKGFDIEHIEELPISKPASPGSNAPWDLPAVCGKVGTVLNPMSGHRLLRPIC